MDTLLHMNETAAAANWSTGGRSYSTQIPDRKWHEMARLMILPALFLVGGPLNLAAFTQLITNTKAVTASARRMHLLKLHLNVSDLMILFVYTTSQICWLITYEWRGGELLCKLIKFLQTLSFGISSNVVVCIAFDRAASVFASRRHSGEDRAPGGMKRVKISLVLAWVFAVLCAAPQFFVWTAVRPFMPHSAWTQCISWWYVQKLHGSNATSFRLGSLEVSKSAYALFHLLAVFWIPALLIAMCYLNVAAWLAFQGVKFVNPVSCVLRALRGWRKSPVIAAAPGRHYSATGVTERARVTVVVDESAQVRLLPAGYQNTVDGNLENFASPKGSGCSNTPLLGPGTPGHRASSSSRNPSASTVPVAVFDLQNIKRRAIRTSVLLVVAYIVTWLPYNVISLWGLIDEVHYKQYSNSVSFLQYLIVFNSVINPFLYGTVGKLKKYVSNN